MLGCILSPSLACAATSDNIRTASVEVDNATAMNRPSGVSPSPYQETLDLRVCHALLPETSFRCALQARLALLERNLDIKPEPILSTALSTTAVSVKHEGPDTDGDLKWKRQRITANIEVVGLTND